MDEAPLNIKKWIVLYPIYIHSKKTIAEGRRISAAKACENPTCIEIGDCCNYLRLPNAIELDKAYPRDFMQRGRVRVLLKREDGSPYNPAITSTGTNPGAIGTFFSQNHRNLMKVILGSAGNGKQLMLQVAELVPKHHGRTKKQEPASTSTTGPSKSGKGGKKKK